jgi:hypothetical protein
VVPAHRRTAHDSVDTVAPALPESIVSAPQANRLSPLLLPSVERLPLRAAGSGLHTEANTIAQSVMLVRMNIL